jgi:fucose 4-O-acetylase-like acetyltransferase
LIVTAHPRRIVFLDIAKGLAIILVVLGHSIGGISLSHCCGEGAYARDIAYVIYTFHMPAFFFISGILTQEREGSNTAQSVARIMTSIVYPYILWSTIQTSAAILADSAVNTPRNVSDLFQILYAPRDQFWFLYTLCLIRLLDVFVLKSQSKRIIVALLAADLVVYLLLFWNASNPTNLNNLLYGLAFYLLGRTSSITAVSRLPPVLAIVALVALVAFGALGKAYDIGHRSLVPAALAGIACLLTLAVQIDRHRGTLAVALSRLGRYSMAIFLVHAMASAAARFVLLWVFDAVNYWAAVAVTTSAGLMVPLAIALLADRLGLSPYLGFGRDHAAARRPGEHEKAKPATSQSN